MLSQERRRNLHTTIDRSFWRQDKSEGERGVHQLPARKGAGKRTRETRYRVGRCACLSSVHIIPPERQGRDYPTEQMPLVGGRYSFRLLNSGGNIQRADSAAFSRQRQ